MENWEKIDDYMIYNESEKRVITWCVYGENKEYFLSQEYYYNNDIFEDDNDRFTLINELIDCDNTLESLITRTKAMV